MWRRTSAGVRLGLTLLAFGLLPLLPPRTASGKNGMVITKDRPPLTFVGDVDDATEPGFITISSAAGKTKLDSRNVEKVTYFNTAADEFNGRLAALDRRDVNARLQLANFAITNRMYPQARELLVSALQIEPANRNAADLLRQVDDQIKAAQPAQTRPAAPADNAAPPGPPGSARARRTLTPDEVNFLRQFEWTDSDTTVPVKVTPEARKGALDLGLVDSDSLGRMSPADLGWIIVHKGPPELRKGVKLSADPGTLASYKGQVQKFVITTCATGACHNTDKGGSFFLFADPAQSDVNVLSDYIILQEYSRTLAGVEYQMIDRLHPEDSLLIQFSLPPGAAKVAHPKAAGYVAPPKPPFMLQKVQAWIASLPAVTPSYDIDLSKPAPKPEGAKPAIPAANPAPAGAGRSGVGAG